MSVDTANKRRMAANVKFRGRRFLPIADGTIDEEDRYILLGAYLVPYPPEMETVGRIRLSVGGIRSVRTYNTIRLSTGGVFRIGVKTNV